MTELAEIAAIPGFPGYFASRDGDIFSTKRTKLKKLKGADARGYRRHAMFVNQTKIFVPAHHLVLLTFVGPRPDGLPGLHNDGNKMNNHADNLRWDTYASNSADQIKHGVIRAGERNGMSRLDSATVNNIRYEAAKGTSTVEIARKFGIGRDYVRKIVTRVAWARS